MSFLLCPIKNEKTKVKELMALFKHITIIHHIPLGHSAYSANP